MSVVVIRVSTTTFDIESTLSYPSCYTLADDACLPSETYMQSHVHSRKPSAFSKFNAGCERRKWFAPELLSRSVLLLLVVQQHRRWHLKDVNPEPFVNLTWKGFTTQVTCSLLTSDQHACPFTVYVMHYVIHVRPCWRFTCEENCGESIVRADNCSMVTGPT